MATRRKKRHVKTTSRRKTSSSSPVKKRRKRRKSMGEGLAEEFNLTNSGSGVNQLMQGLIGAAGAWILNTAASDMSSVTRRAISLGVTLGAIAFKKTPIAIGFGVTTLMLELKAEAGAKKVPVLGEGNADYLSEGDLAETYLLSEPAVLDANGNPLPFASDERGNLIRL